MASGSTQALNEILQANLTAQSAVSVTPNDAADLKTSRGLYVGGAGNIALRLVNDSTEITYQNVQAGTILPFAVKRVMATNTTATNIVALY